MYARWTMHTFVAPNWIWYYVLTSMEFVRCCYCYNNITIIIITAATAAKPAISSIVICRGPMCTTMMKSCNNVAEHFCHSETIYFYVPATYVLLLHTQTLLLTGSIHYTKEHPWEEYMWHFLKRLGHSGGGGILCGNTFCWLTFFRTYLGCDTCQNQKMLPFYQFSWVLFTISLQCQVCPWQSYWT